MTRDDDPTPLEILGIMFGFLGASFLIAIGAYNVVWWVMS